MSARAVPALQVEELVVRRGGRRLLDRVSLRLGEGEVLALLGPNGAGKTTLFRAIAGTVRPDEGHVALFGRTVDGWPLHRRARAGLGVLPQEASAFRALTVRQNLQAVLELRVPRAQRATRAATLLARFGLEAVADVRAGRLSGGERRRTELARLLAAGPRLLVLDEPFSGLDPQSADDVRGHLASLATDGIGVLFSDHAVERALGACSRACILAGGVVVVDGRPDEVRASPTAHRVYLNPGFH